MQRVRGLVRGELAGELLVLQVAGAVFIGHLPQLIQLGLICLVFFIDFRAILVVFFTLGADWDGQDLVIFS